MKGCIMNIRTFTIAAIMAASSSIAHAAPANMLIYISPQEYTHSVKLWQYFDDYWFQQGPTIEPIARSMLAQEYGEVAMCQANSEGKSLVWIKPRMYYNPQMKTFYGEITASTFTSNGEAVASYIGESKKHGFLDVYPQKQIESTYQMAMENLLEKMRADQQLKSIATDGTTNNNAGAACATVAALPPVSPIDINYFFKRVN
jgi:hypothetical protein